MCAAITSDHEPTLYCPQWSANSKRNPPRRRGHKLCHGSTESGYSVQGPARARLRPSNTYRSVSTIAHLNRNSQHRISSIFSKGCKFDGRCLVSCYRSAHWAGGGGRGRYNDAALLSLRRNRHHRIEDGIWRITLATVHYPP